MPVAERGCVSIEFESVACYLCGEETDVRRLGRMEAQGPSDLDGRPGPPLRTAICDEVQRCSTCGFCSPDLGSSPGLPRGQARQVLETPGYQGQLVNPRLNSAANNNLCWALICREARRFEAAGQAVLRAAWLCDDGGAVEAARWCRERALELYLQAPSLPAVQAMQVELLRRLGRFEAARTTNESLLKQRLPAELSRAARLQKVLIQNQDSGSASMATKT